MFPKSLHYNWSCYAFGVALTMVHMHSESKPWRGTLPRMQCENVRCYGEASASAEVKWKIEEISHHLLQINLRKGKGW